MLFSKIRRGECHTKLQLKRWTVSENVIKLLRLFYFVSFTVFAFWDESKRRTWFTRNCIEEVGWVSIGHKGDLNPVLKIELAEVRMCWAGRHVRTKHCSWRPFENECWWRSRGKVMAYCWKLRREAVIGSASIFSR